jgi:hypothetical protein
VEKISKFAWTLHSRTATWECGGVEIRKSYANPIRSAVLLRDASGVAIVEPFQEAGLNNAVVFNADGSERFRLSFPALPSRGYGYDQAYYIDEALNAFVNLGGVDFRYVIDESEGRVLAQYEAR